MEQKIKFSVENFKNFEYDNNLEFAIGRLLFLSTRPNSHKIPISEEILRGYGQSIVGKWVVAEYDKFRMDTTTHTNNQHIVGIIPQNANVEFVRAEDGYLDAYVDCVISKIYATDVYEIFVNDNHRSVSVEMIVGYENDNQDMVSSLNITAVTILGRKYNPSVPNASLELTRFSEEDANQFYIKNKIDNFVENRKNLNGKTEGGNMVKDEKNLETQETVEEEKLEESTVVEEDKEQVEEPTNEPVEDKDNDDDKDESEEEDKDDDSEEEGQSEEEEEKVDYEALLAEKDNAIQEKDNIIMEQKAELETLRTFKAETEKFQKDEVVKTTLAKVKDKMAKNVYEEFEAEAETCSFAEIDSWKNKVLASVAEVILSKDENANLLQFATNQVVDTNKNKKELGLWNNL